MFNMKESDIRRLKAVLLYILKRMPKDSRDVYHIVKTAFFAQKNHLVQYGIPMYNDEIVALQFGPVPSLVYNVLKVARGESAPYKFCDDKLLARLSAPIDFQDEIFSTNEDPDMDCLSRSSVECLDAAIDQVSKMGFGELKHETHGSEWSRAFNNDGSHRMEEVNIAKENGASEEMLDYLSRSMELDKMMNDKCS